MTIAKSSERFISANSSSEAVAVYDKKLVRIFLFISVVYFGMTPHRLYSQFLIKARLGTDSSVVEGIAKESARSLAHIITKDDGNHWGRFINIGKDSTRYISADSSQETLSTTDMRSITLSVHDASKIAPWAAFFGGYGFIGGILWGLIDYGASYVQLSDLGPSGSEYRRRRGEFLGIVFGDALIIGTASAIIGALAGIGVYAIGSEKVYEW